MGMERRGKYTYTDSKPPDLQSNFAMRTETNRVEEIIIRFPVNQDQVGLDMAVSVINPITRERMIEVMAWQYLVVDKQTHNIHQDSIKRFSMPS